MAPSSGYSQGHSQGTHRVLAPGADLGLKQRQLFRGLSSVLSIARKGNGVQRHRHACVRDEQCGPLSVARLLPLVSSGSLSVESRALHMRTLHFRHTAASCRSAYGLGIVGVAWPRCLACSVRAVLTYQIGKDLLVNHSTAHVARVVRGAEVIADHIEHPERRLFVHQHLPTVGLASATVGRIG